MITETLKNPNVVTLPNPIGIDRAIQSIQLSLGMLTWLEKSFGRAWTIPRNEPSGAKIAEPMLYQGTKEYYPALPNDALKSYSFFRVPSSRSTAEYAANMNNRSYMFTDPVDLIVWADLKDVDPSKDYVYKEELIREVLNRLNLDPNVQVLRIWDDRVEDIFKGYTLQTTHRDLLMYPYTAFRIEMNLRYSILCDGLPIPAPPVGPVPLTAELLKVAGGLDATLKTVVGNGQNSPLKLSTATVGLNGYTDDLVATLQTFQTAAQVATIAGALALTAENNAKAYADGLVVGLVSLAGDQTITGKKTFTPTTTGAGLSVGNMAGDPSSGLVNGAVWHNNTTNRIRWRINGATSNMVTAASDYVANGLIISAGTGSHTTSSANLTYAGTLTMISSRANFSTIGSQPNTNATSLLSLRSNTTYIVTGENSAGGLVYSVTPTGIVTLNGYEVWNSIVSPAQITTNQDNYNPVGFGTGAILRLNSSGAVNITSLAGGVGGRLCIICNVGSFNITLKNDDGITGTAINRFAMNADRIVLPGESVMVWYDGTSTRWRVIT